MPKYVNLPDPIGRGRGKNREWWIPACPPHYTEEVGPYSSEDDAVDDQLGMEELINTPAWRSHIMDLEDDGLI